MSELKPCPFCGRKAELIQTKCLTNGCVLYHVFHYDLRCPTDGIRTENRQTQEEAIEAWNRRAAEAVKVETNIYDKEEIFPDCTVQVLTNTATGETSVGWWKNG